MDRQWRPSATSQGLSAVHIRPMTPSYTPPQFLLPEVRDPRRDFPVLEPFGSMWHDSQQRQHVHPEALGSPSGSVVPAGHRLLRPHPPLWISSPPLMDSRRRLLHPRLSAWGGNPEVPQFTPLDCARVPPPIPRWPRRVHMTVASSSVLAFTPGNRFGDHIGRFEAAEFVLSSNSCSYYGPRAG